MDKNLKRSFDEDFNMAKIEIIDHDKYIRTTDIDKQYLIDKLNNLPDRVGFKLLLNGIMLYLNDEGCVNVRDENMDDKAKISTLSTNGKTTRVMQYIKRVMRDNGVAVIEYHVSESNTFEKIANRLLNAGYRVLYNGYRVGDIESVKEAYIIKNNGMMSRFVTELRRRNI